MNFPNINTLTEAEIIQINRRMIQTFGGLFISETDNLLNPGSLKYLLAIVQNPIIDSDPYPTIAAKAAFIAWRIITGHIFMDGNKRTGMESCRQVLELNGYILMIDQGVIDLALQIATNAIRFTDFVKWVENHIIRAGE